jgi:hypothetical protein
MVCCSAEEKDEKIAKGFVLPARLPISPQRHLAAALAGVEPAMNRFLVKYSYSLLRPERISE